MQNNYIYFGGLEGIDYFVPEQIDTSNHFPPIYLDEFRLYNIPIKAGDSTKILLSCMNETNHIELKYNQNFLSFSFKEAFGVTPGDYPDFVNKQK